MPAPADAERLDLRRPRHIHVVGVGGAGMSAIAEVLVGMGHRVSGSDLKPSPHLERLRGLGVAISVGHARGNVDGADLVTSSTAVPEGNPELVAARERGIPRFRRAAMLAAITVIRRTVAIAGTHGKTTVASMLALILARAGLRPSFIIGGEVNEIGSGAAWDDGEWLVVEADESDGTFLELHTDVAVLTNLEADHLSHYGSFEGLRSAFDRFIAAVPGPCVVCADDPEAMGLAAAARGAITYGTAEGAEFRMVPLESHRTGTRFELHREGTALAEVRLPVPGWHNARNATAALVAATAVGVPVAAAVEALSRYGGVARRFQFRGESNGVTYIDDYAHLPTEVGAALAAAASGGWRRIVCVFQPHRYSRTAELWPSFARAFDQADLLVLTEIYPAGEAPRPGVSAKLIVNAVLDASPARRVAYLPRRSDLVAYLGAVLRPGDVCLTLGAGDLTSLPGEMVTETRGPAVAK